MPTGAQEKKEFWLAYEGGGSKTRILLGDTSGQVLGRELGGGASQLYVTTESYVRTTRPMLLRLKKQAAVLGGSVTTVGLAAPMHFEAVQAMLSEVFDDVEIVHTGEGELGLAQYDLCHGATLIAGTGASCYCLDERGHEVVVGGFGPQFGDEGSGYWIGREGISAVFCVADARGEVTLLQDMARTHYRVDKIQEMLNLVDSGGHVSGPAVASFTPHVVDAAREGDGVARHILARAGGHLGRLVLDAAGLSKMRCRPIPVVPTGGVFGAGGLILTPMKRVLKRSGIAFDVFPPVLEPAQGLFNIIASRLRR